MTVSSNKWNYKKIRHVLLPLADGKVLHQGFSPRCETTASTDPMEWAVLKTTSIQDGRFEERFNKRLPATIAPRPNLEVRQGDILITCAGPRVRCGVACLVAQTRARLMISGKMYRFRADEAVITADFLLAYLRSPEGQAAIDQMKTGGNESGLNLTHERFFQLEVPVAPLSEQRRIIGRLNEMSVAAKQAREELSHIPKLAERYKQAVLTAAFRGDLTAGWRVGNKSSPSVDQLHSDLLNARRDEWNVSGNKRSYKAPANGYAISDDLPELPQSWKYIPVEHLSTKVVDGVHKKPDYKPDGIPFLTVRNLTAGPGIDFSDVRYVSQADHEEFSKRANPTSGDILITKDGTLGVIRAIRSTDVFSIFVSLALVKPVRKDMTDFLELAFQSPIVQGQMVGVGTGLQHIHLTDLKKDLIPVAPLAEQTVIVERVRLAFSAIESALKEAVRAAGLLKRLDHAILTKAFRGELVAQGEKHTSVALIAAE